MKGTFTLKIVQEGILDDLHSEKKEGKVAIVNAANPGLFGKSGAALAIQQGGGEKLINELKERGKNGCNVTKNVVTEPYDLQKKDIDYIIHAVGPDFKNSTEGFTRYGNRKAVDFEEEPYINLKTLQDLAQAALTETYVNIVESAIKHGVKTILCPVMSGGKFRGGFTEDNIAYMTIQAIGTVAEKHQGSGVTLVLCAFDNKKSKEHYLQPLQHYQENSQNISAFAPKFTNLLSKEKGICSIF